MRVLIIFYDNFCPYCTKFARLIKKLDWLKLLQIKQLRNEFDTNSFCGIDLERAKQQIASYDTKWHYGYNSLFYVFARLPSFWIYIPFLYILKITTLGQLMYIELALKRKIIPIHCDAETCEI